MSYSKYHCVLGFIVVALSVSLTYALPYYVLVWGVFSYFGGVYIGYHGINWYQE